MLNRLKVYSQYLAPQHFLSALVGWVAELRIEWFKHWLISWFVKRYQVNMQEALMTDIHDYPTFNSFFTRQLNPAKRPISPLENAVVFPVDGILLQFGGIKKDQLLQSKGHYFTLESLLGGDQALANYFIEGDFATFYLGPKNYHRVHMPLTGTLLKTHFIPGSLFSVNPLTASLVPNLYSRNQRLVTVFETKAGRVAIILVGAMIVGGIQTVWKTEPYTSKKISQETFQQGPQLIKGSELGFFKTGSSVTLLFEKNKINWSNSLQLNAEIFYGQLLATL